MMAPKELAEEYATWIRHPLRMDGTEVEVKYFSQSRYDSFLAGYKAGMERAAKICDKFENADTSAGVIRAEYEENEGYGIASASRV